MRAVRALNARTEADSVVQQELSNARRALERAMSAAKKARVGGKTQGRRGLAVERAISAALGQISQVPHLTPLWDLDDPDHLPEDVLAEMGRERRKSQDAARLMAKKQAEAEAERLAAEEARLIEEMLDEALVAERMG